MASFRYRDRRFQRHPEIGHDDPEWPITINRNQRSRSAGIAGHDAAEYPLGGFLLSRLEREKSTIDVPTLTIDGAHFATWIQRPEDRILFSLVEDFAIGDADHGTAAVAFADEPIACLPVPVRDDAATGPADGTKPAESATWALKEADHSL